jgi:predicted acylesterase/phospholipase RssA
MDKLTDIKSGVDLVLSSGFLAFARHLGFLKAVDIYQLPINGVCGTSSGAFIAALWASGHSIDDIRNELTQKKPLEYLMLTVWKGLFTLQPMIDFLKTKLPHRIEDLPMPFGIAVVDQDKRHRILTSGPLAESVAASCAVPFLFQPIIIEGKRYQDGGVTDRLGLSAWQKLHPNQTYCVHQVSRTRGKDQDHNLAQQIVVHSERSYAKLWDLGPFDQQIDESYQRAAQVFATHMNTK